MALLLLLALLIAIASPAVADPRLHELRAARRAAVRSAAVAKVDGGSGFGLLVLPVDFSDARFDSDFDLAEDLAPRLADDPAGALGHYVDTASQGRTGLSVILAPVISLDGQRLDYSDIGWQGSERTRRMAREALERARELGVEFDAADRDRDGEVDGVLILHAAPGLENDPEGLIVPLQYFLAEPVVQRGTTARSYAVAAERSTLGIWAHETAHLLGLEDRYDHALAGDGETGPRGGLGRFSLMASGWLGTGDGSDPALPDAYSRLSLGWVDLAAEPAPGTVARPRLTDPGSSEYFLVEQRDPAGNAPYDAGIPAHRALIYQVDESLAEGQASAPVWPRHLRVQLVEADAGEELARGENDGSDDDLFPFANTTQPFHDNTFPDARTWAGRETGAHLEITSDGNSLVYSDLGLTLGADVRLPLVAVDTFRPVAKLPPGSALPDTLTLDLAVVNPEFGQFPTGATYTCELIRTSPGQWHDHEGPLVPWIPAATLPADAITRFTYSVEGGAVAAGDLVHVWDDQWADLDLQGSWPGNWTIAHPEAGGATTWHRWLAGGDVLPAGPVLACTGEVYATATSWPDVLYANSSHAQLVSAPLGTGITWVEMRHSAHLELLHPGAAVDGVALTWVHAGGVTVGATPVDGWLGTVDPRSRQPLAGQPTFAVSDSLGGDGAPFWRREILRVPDPAQYGPGPWRLQLELASNPIYGDRGWLVRAFETHVDEAPEGALPLWLDDSSLRWTWVAVANPTCFEIQRSDDGGSGWRTVATLSVPGGSGPDHSVPREQLGLQPGVRSRLRVIAECTDRVISREIIAADPAEPSLSLPRPNPCNDHVSIRVDGAGDGHTELGVFDLRGRRIRVWRPGGDSTTVVWEGDEASGRRVAAGVYIFRLRAQGRTLTRKVTWLR